jgi:hypothetical protein
LLRKANIDSEEISILDEEDIILEDFDEEEEALFDNSYDDYDEE